MNPYDVTITIEIECYADNKLQAWGKIMSLWDEIESKIKNETTKDIDFVDGDIKIRELDS